MKKCLIVLLFLSLIPSFYACAPADCSPADVSPGVRSVSQGDLQRSPVSDSTGGADGQDLRETLTYYEQLVIGLQAELQSTRSRLNALRQEMERVDTAEAGVSAQLPFSYRKENGGAVITGYTGTGGSVLIPACVDGLPVIAIADRAFAGRNDLTDVTIPEGVTQVGWFAFSGCVSLRSVSIPSCVTQIEYGAFENCQTASLTVFCPSGSYAERYARSYGMLTKNPA